MADEHIPRFRDELGATIRLAAPLAAASLAQIGMGLTDTVLLGGLGSMCTAPTPCAAKPR